MKKLLSAILSMLIIISAVPICASAQERITLTDIRAAVSLIVQGEYDEKYDVDNSGNLTVADIRMMIAEIAARDNTANANYSSFSANMIKNSYSIDKNTVFSPVSIAYLLGLIGSGADSETSKNIAALLGEKSLDGVNTTLGKYALQNSSATGVDYNIVANSVWSKGLVNTGYRGIVNDTYKADIYENGIDADAVNAWVDQKTNGIIPRAINSLPADTDILLVNTVAFNSRWFDKFASEDITEGDFNCADGSVRTVSMLSSTETTMVNTANAVGFEKPYIDKRYSFIAVLPKEGDLQNYLNSFDGTELQNILNGREKKNVNISLPEFEAESDYNLNSVFDKMGSGSILENADLSAIAPNGGTISAGHVAKISVGENGTKAAAASFAAAHAKPYAKENIIFDKPFMYIVYDNQYQMPLFIGTVNSCGVVK